MMLCVSVLLCNKPKRNHLRHPAGELEGAALTRGVRTERDQRKQT